MKKSLIVLLTICTVLTGCKNKKNPDNISDSTSTNISQEISNLDSSASEIDSSNIESVSSEPSLFTDPLEIYVLEMCGIYGDSVYLKQGDIDILIDAGWDSDGDYVKSFVDDHCTDNTIDLLVVTHPHGDHVGGMTKALSDRSVSRIIDYGTFASTPSSSENGLAAYEILKKELISNGTIYHSAFECVNSDGAYKTVQFNDNFSVEVMNTGYYYTDGIATSSDANGHSVSLLFKYGDFTFLTQGDATSNTEASLLKNEPNLGEVTMYKASHHGSSGSNSTAFLNKIAPKEVCISASRALSYNNRTNTSTNIYGAGGHPSDSAVERIYNSKYIRENLNVYWNMYAGTMKFETYGSSEPVEMQGAGPERLGYYVNVDGIDTKVTGEENKKFSDTEVFKARGYNLETMIKPISEPIPDDPIEQPSYNDDYESMEFSTHSDYFNSDNETLLKVQGVVTINNGVDSVFIQDGQEGYQIYDANLVDKLKVGNTYTIVGTKKNYQGQREIVDIVYWTYSDDELVYDVNNLAGKNVANDADMEPYHGSLCKVEAAIINKIPDMSKTTFTIGMTYNNSNLNLYVNSKYLSSEDYDTIKDFFTNEVGIGSAINVEGIMSAFGYSRPYSPQIQLYDVSKVTKAVLSDKQVVDNTISQIELPSSVSTEINSINLVTSVKGSNATITYVSSNPEIIANDGTITHPDNDTKVTITAKASLNGVEASKEFEINVLGNALQGTLIYAETFTHENGGELSQYGQSGIKQSYADGIVWFVDSNHKWDLNNALHGGSGSDHYYTNTSGSTDTWCLRCKTINASAESAVTTEFATANLSYIEFYATGYGSYTGTTVHVSYSTDKSAWTLAGSVELTSQLSNYRIYINQEEAVYIRFTFENETTTKATTSLDYIRFYSE